MKFTLSWLKAHLETEASLDKIAARRWRISASPMWWKPNSTPMRIGCAR
jgi:hypothetical protein